MARNRTIKNSQGKDPAPLRATAVFPSGRIFGCFEKLMAKYKSEDTQSHESTEEDALVGGDGGRKEGRKKGNGERGGKGEEANKEGEEEAMKERGE